ncbi:GATA zinc finger domain-containing protein 14-like isoform X1 [Neodiprion fabricii]|uniref:GATA zinc finger domain-containing protein 14-like isoform X1 n=1 Tax=Neodiprion fabricii TaxID=2872261 RepID=UPI001ED8D3C3|nr:GATA zinc finger domain-containing protein 14-like isoform X1 [Neodiprion fabricii]
MADQRIFTTLLVAILWGCVLGLQRPAPRYSQQLMPDTSFTCHHKIIGSYYADPETDCQLFHVCVSVAGTVQDYRFLCPNDTAFDQESQTCADWYDVDCEAATLYYASDNFDLYRLGSGLESRRYDGTQNDLEPLDHLQRSESSDPVRSSVNNLNRVAPSTNTNNNNNRDILRGSSSSNFFNNRHNGKEDDYDNEKIYREPEQSQAEPKRKSGVRKVARKQQFNSNSNVITPTTATPSTAFENQNRNNNQNSGSSYNQRNNNQNNGNYNQQRNYNYNNFNQRQTQTNNYPTSSSARPYVEQTNNYPTSSSARPYFEQTNNYPTSSSARPYVEQTNNYPRNNQNRNYNTPSSTFRPATTNAFQGSNYNNNNNNNNEQTAGGFGNFDSSKFGATNQQTTNYGSTIFDRTPAVTTTVRSTDFTANVATKIKKPTDQSSPTFTNQFNQFSTQPTTLRPSTSFQTTDYTGYYQKNYNTIQRTANTGGTTFQTSTFASTSYDDYSVTPRTSEPQTANKVQTTRQQDFTQTTQRFANSFAGSSYIPTTYSPVTKKQATIGNANTQGQVINRGNDQYTGQYESARTTNSGQYRERNTQQTEQTYDTSRSNDNSGQYNREVATKAPKKVATQYNNYESKTNFDGSTKSFDNFDQGGRTASVNGFSPASVNKLAESPVTVRATTPVPRRTVYNNPTTQRPSSAAATNYASQTTPNSRTGNFVSATPRPFTSTTRTVDRRQESTTAKSKSEKKNDYDYAYYDNAGALEYDGIDLEQVGGSRDTAKVTRN